MFRASYALVQATVGVGTVIIPYIGVAYTRGGGTHLALKTYRVRQGWGVFRGVHMQQGSHRTNPMGAASKSSADPCHLACHQHAFTTRAQHLRVNGLAEL